VDLTYHDGADGIALVEALTAAPDAEAVRRRNQEYLASIEASNGKHD
jgi:thiamine monophosphate synthase